MIDGYSPIAIQVEHRTDAIRTRVPWGLCLHTTGRGVPTAAKKRGKTPIEVALRIYKNSQNGGNGYPWGGPAYVIDYDGTIYQLAPDDVRTQHVGAARRTYLSGAWLKKASPKAVELWRARWQGYASPQHLFPDKYPNTSYVGCELIPCGSGFGTPWRPGLTFTEAQHTATIRLGSDLAERHGWPAGWAATSRLVGHEDVGLVDRCDRGGGWDPGALRDAPRFDFVSVRAQLAG